MNDETHPMPEDEAKQKGSNKGVVLFVVAALFLGLILGKVAAGPNAPAPSSGAAPTPAASATITSTHNDAVADYEAALKTGLPVYVLFHSLSCQPCVEISALVDRVIPEYEGEVVFVNAISDDPSGQQLAAKFSFQYIPTSFFLAPDGTVAESFTGSMDEAQLRGHLDSLISPP